MAQSFKIADQRIGFQGIHETSTEQLHPLGTRCHAIDAADGPGEFMYLQGKANTVQGSWVVIDMDNGSTTLLDTDTSGLKGAIGVAMSANIGNQYGWYAIYGKIEAQMAASFADDGLIFATSTAGVCDDAQVDNWLISGACGAGTIVGAGLCEVQLSHPFLSSVEDGVAADT